MSSEPQIQAATPPAHDEADFAIGYLLTSMRTRMLQALDAGMNPHGMTGAQFTILRRVAEGAANTAADLCRLLQYDTGSMTRMLDRLEEKGVICRERSQEDRRVVFIKLTEQGTQLYPILKEVAHHAGTRVFAPLSPPELQQLRELLTRLVTG